jgi:hypothetical protein
MTKKMNCNDLKRTINFNKSILKKAEQMKSQTKHQKQMEKRYKKECK